jgi:hypothetical protein
MLRILAIAMALFSTQALAQLVAPSDLERAREICVKRWFGDGHFTTPACLEIDTRWVVEKALEEAEEREDREFVERVAWGP